ncbi:MAG: DUF3667 domain-containing protein [Phaeodactylibacter sp.]|nr:DUF3667 domain-containing protein [Phaeodactylibacter sp.]MCB9299593.1 DUF3667 domain-containing protein [Lewinellaceae bacterium]
MQQHLHQNQCLSCGHFLYGKYCSHCGEKLLESHERSLGHLVGEFLGTLFNFDNKFFKSIRQMLRRPGQLSLDYANGRRRPYLRPSGLFLILTAIYFVFAPFEIFVATLNTHMEHTNYQAYASRIVQEKLAEDKLTLEELNQSFNQRTASLAKWLILLFLPVAGLILSVLFYKRGSYIADHFVLGIELNSYNLLMHFLLLPIFLTPIVFFARLLAVSHFQINDTILVPAIGLSFATFSTLAFRRFYGQKWWLSILKALIFLFLIAQFAFVFYRLILFWLTMQLI